jgi:hypothetical protein
MLVVGLQEEMHSNYDARYTAYLGYSTTRHPGPVSSVAVQVPEPTREPTVKNLVLWEAEGQPV